MVGDDHGLADAVVRGQPAGGVGEDHRLHARGGRGPDAVDDGLDAAALVEVGAAQEEQHLPVADPHRPHLAAVPDGGGAAKPGRSPIATEPSAAPKASAAGAQPGAHDDRHVVLRRRRRR